METFISMYWFWRVANWGDRSKQRNCSHLERQLMSGLFRLLFALFLLENVSESFIIRFICWTRQKLLMESCHFFILRYRIVVASDFCSKTFRQDKNYVIRHSPCSWKWNILNINRYLYNNVADKRKYMQNLR